MRAHDPNITGKIRDSGWPGWRSLTIIQGAFNSMFASDHVRLPHAHCARMQLQWEIARFNVLLHTIRQGLQLLLIIRTKYKQSISIQR